MVRYSAADAERLTPEVGKAGDGREPWEIDRARILHSAAFRRLQRKTQVFAPGEGDFFRTRLTHSIEVAQIAKGIAIRVGANPTLCEAASLAHDIGHPPFGHAGERVLNECMAQAGGFEGNAQNLRVLAALEIKSDDYLGLNLTRATLDALLKYKRSHSEARARGEGKFFYDEELPLVDWVCRGERDERTSFECQIMSWADDVAYSVHDMEDGMWAEVITLERLRGLAPSSYEMESVLRELSRVLAVDGDRRRKAAQKTWSSFAIYEMVMAATASPVGDSGRGARYGWRLTIEPGAVVKSRILKGIAEKLLFSDPRVAAVQPRARTIVGGLFEALTARPDLIPPDFSAADRCRAACDYISGMTDDYAEDSYIRLRGRWVP
ncbi:MAG: deoxyguanosinetriphosphate triphosphohydrolase family protein [Chloroflexota bacterium]